VRSTRWVFLALAILASIQVLWWAYLVIHQQTVIADLIGSPEALEKARSYRTMIIFEGLFFVFVWSLGVWYAYRSIRSLLQLQDERRSFLSAVTHELKTPLSTIQLSLETIAKPQVTEEQRKNFISRSLFACKKLFNEIEMILTYNESERISQKENFLLRDLLADVSSEFSEQVKVKTHADLNTSVYASYPESKTILKSIIDNAIKYSSNNNTPEILVTASTNKNWVRFEIKDNGIGLSEDELKHVFTPFWRSDSAKNLALSGTGLGLTLSSKLARKNSVRITLDSKGKGQGTIVYLDWPRVGSYVES
jgi:two-component system, OmpR family, phosphate regulon sensor histidine kinase PhoR